MSRHKFPSPPAAKKDANDTETTNIHTNASIAPNTSAIPDANPDNLVSWIDSLKLRVDKTLSQQNHELRKLRESAREEELRLKYRTHVFDEQFHQLGEYLKNQSPPQLALQLPYIEEEEQALVDEDEQLQFPEEESELEYPPQDAPSEEESDVIEIISSEEEADEWDGIERPIEAEDAQLEEEEQALEEGLEPLVSNDDSGAELLSGESFAESEEETETHPAPAHRPSFHLKDGRPRLSDVISTNYFEQADEDEEEESEDLEEHAEEDEDEDLEEHAEEDEDEEIEDHIGHIEHPETQSEHTLGLDPEQYAEESENDNFAQFDSYEEDDQEQSENEDDQANFQSLENHAPRISGHPEPEDDSIIVLSSDAESAEEKFDSEADSQSEEEAEPEEEVSPVLGEQPSGGESDAEAELNNESAEEDDDNYFTAIHNVADESNLFANIAQEALSDDQPSLTHRIPSDYPADVESDEPLPPHARVMLSETIPVLQNQSDPNTFDSGNLSSQFDLGTLSGPKRTEEDASEGSLADADTDYKRIDDIPEEGIPHPSLKFPVFKTVKDESLEEVLQKLRETEAKYHIKLNAVEQLKSELGISEEPEEVVEEENTQNELHLQTTFHDALQFDSLVIEDLQHISNEISDRGLLLSDLESSRPTLDSIVDEMLQKNSHEDSVELPLEKESIEAILAVASTILDTHGSENENELQLQQVSNSISDLPELLIPIERGDSEPEFESESKSVDTNFISSSKDGEPPSPERQPDDGKSLPSKQDIIEELVMEALDESDLMDVEPETVTSEPLSQPEVPIENVEVSHSDSELEVQPNQSGLQFDVDQRDTNTFVDERPEVPQLEQLYDESTFIEDESLADIETELEIADVETETSEQAQTHSFERELTPWNEGSEVGAVEEIVEEIEEVEEIEIHEVEILDSDETQAHQDQSEHLSEVKNPEKDSLEESNEASPQPQASSSLDELDVDLEAELQSPVDEVDEVAEQDTLKTPSASPEIEDDPLAYSSYVKPDYPILANLSQDEWELDEEASIVEPFSPEEILVTYDENTIVEAVAAIPTSIQEPDQTELTVQEVVYALDIMTEVHGENTDEVETPTEVVEPEEQEEEVVVEVYEETTEVISPSGIVELESEFERERTPLVDSATFISEEIIEYASESRKRKRESDDFSSSGFKRLKKALGRWNPLNWIAKKDDPLEQFDEFVEHSLEVHYQEYQEVLMQASVDFEVSEPEDLNNESEDTEEEDEIEIDEVEKSDSEPLEDFNAAPVRPPSPAVLAGEDSETESEEVLDRLKYAAEETVELVSEAVSAPVDKSENVDSAKFEETLLKAKEAGETVYKKIEEEVAEPATSVPNEETFDASATFQQLKEAGKEVYEAISEDISEPATAIETPKSPNDLTDTLKDLKEAGKQVYEAISQEITEPVTIVEDDTSSKQVEEVVNNLKEAGTEVVEAIADAVSEPVAEYSQQHDVDDKFQLLATSTDAIQEAAEQDEIIPDIETTKSGTLLDHMKEAGEEVLKVISDEVIEPVTNDDVSDDKSAIPGDTILRLKEAGKEVVNAIAEDISEPVSKDEAPESSEKTIEKLKEAGTEVYEAISEQISEPVNDQPTHEAGLDDMIEPIPQLALAVEDVYEAVAENIEEPVSGNDVSTPAELETAHNFFSDLKEATKETVNAISEEISEPVSGDFKHPGSVAKVAESFKDDVKTEPRPVFNLIAPLTDNLLDSTAEISNTEENHKAIRDIGQDDSEVKTESAPVSPKRLESSARVSRLMSILKLKAQEKIDSKKDEADNAPQANASEEFETNAGISQGSSTTETKPSEQSIEKESTEKEVNESVPESENATEKSAPRKRPLPKRKAMGLDIEDDVVEPAPTRRSLRNRTKIEDSKTKNAEDALPNADSTDKDKQEPKTPAKTDAKVETAAGPESQVTAEHQKGLLGKQDIKPEDSLESVEGKRGSPRKTRTISSKPLQIPKRRGRAPSTKEEASEESSTLHVPPDKEVRTASGKWQLDLLDHPALRTRSKSPIKRTIQELSQEMDEEPSTKRKRITRSAVQKRLEQASAQGEGGEIQHEHHQEQERRGRTRERQK